MNTVITTLMRSFYKLQSVLLLMTFFLLIFGILWMELFGGSLRGRCFIDPKQNFTAAVHSRLISQQYPFLAANTVNEYGWNADVGLCDLSIVEYNPVVLDGKMYNAICKIKPFCAWADAEGDLQWKTCPNVWMPNPNDMDGPMVGGSGYLSYDNIESAVWLLFCHITMEGWSDVMYMIGGNDPVLKWSSRAFHVIWVLLGSFFVMQLALGVIANKYFGAQEEERTLKAREAMDEQAILQTEKMTKECFTKHSNIKSRSRIMSLGCLERMSVAELSKQLRNLKGTLLRRIPGLQQSVDLFYMLTQQCTVIIHNYYFNNSIVFVIVLNTICMALEHHDPNLYESSICQRRCDIDLQLPANTSCIGPMFNHSFALDERAQKVRYPQERSFCFFYSNPARPDSVSCSAFGTKEECWASTKNCFWIPQTSSVWTANDPDYTPCKLGLYTGEDFGHLGSQELSLRQVCGDDNDQCASFNTEVLAAVSVVNEIFTVIFILEMVLKMLGLGLSEYFDDSWNFFDFVIVSASIVEKILVWFNPTSSQGGVFSVLHSIRLGRLFKLFNHWQTMKKIVTTLGQAVKALWLVMCLFVLIVYIFAFL